MIREHYKKNNQEQKTKNFIKKRKKEKNKGNRGKAWRLLLESVKTNLLLPLVEISLRKNLELLLHTLPCSKMKTKEQRNSADNFLRK